MSVQQKLRYLLLFAIVFLIAGFGYLIQPKDDLMAVNIEQALSEAKNMYTDFDRSATDSERIQGPCLGLIAPHWAVDIVHDPRLAVDNLAENNCDKSAYKYVIELTSAGEVLRVR